ncbi:trypsin-like peptidase domain-containing protein [Sphingomonas guangdongensis]|uniref:trypsin-like peptidase domain-containing protein n=1 Tax=Sphingomonas guangdongensis TaxID=1141890 RepID=UPI001181BEC9|nr:trypsin-like peptidase domain-containing protein [Sphingomonas guangdongensis]
MASLAQADDPDIRERVRALMISASDQAEATFRTAVRPIYGVAENGTPDQLGSAVLVDIDGTRCLMTAAHVIDANEKTTLYVGGDTTLVEINAEFDATVAPESGRRDDHYDFAIAPLPETMLSEMSTLKFVTGQEMAPTSLGRDKLLYTALGFPNSKNKAALAGALKVRGQLYSYSSFARFQPALALSLDVSGDEHVFIDHRKHGRDETGRKVLSIAPRGLSGGAIIQAADFGDREVLLGRKPPEPKLAAITIELYKSHQTLLGTRVDAMLPAWRAAQ